MTPKRRKNGTGTIYKRKDGRHGSSKFVDMPDGSRKRLNTYGKSGAEAQRKFKQLLREIHMGRPTRASDWTVELFLKHWLENVVAIRNRPRTYESYESVVRLYLIPGLGKHRLQELSVHDVQLFLNKKIRVGASPRIVNLIRSVLRAALSRAEREEIISRNVAKLVDVPAWQRKPIVPWTRDEATAFLRAAEGHP